MKTTEQLLEKFEQLETIENKNWKGKDIIEVCYLLRVCCQEQSQKIEYLEAVLKKNNIDI